MISITRQIGFIFFILLFIPTSTYFLKFDIFNSLIFIIFVGIFLKLADIEDAIRGIKK